METGIRNAKNNLSARVADIVPIASAKDPKRGRGMWKGRLAANWEEEFQQAKRQTEADFYNE